MPHAISPYIKQFFSQAKTMLSFKKFSANASVYFETVSVLIFLRAPRTHASRRAKTAEQACCVHESALGSNETKNGVGDVHNRKPLGTQ